MGGNIARGEAQAKTWLEKQPVLSAQGFRGGLADQPIPWSLILSLSRAPGLGGWTAPGWEPGG